MGLKRFWAGGFLNTLWKWHQTERRTEEAQVPRKGPKSAQSARTSLVRAGQRWVELCTSQPACPVFGYAAGYSIPENSPCSSTTNFRQGLEMNSELKGENFYQRTKDRVVTVVMKTNMTFL